jgi:diguanylate cyclase (GGDEF)-like protein
VVRLDLPHAASPGHKQVTLSIGVASARADVPGAHPARLLAAADRALYEAKSAGRNRVAAFTGAALPPAETREVHAPAPALPRSSGMPANKSADQPASDGERAEVASTSAAFDQSDWVLRFPPALERRFLNQVALRLHYFSVSGLLSLLVFNGFLFVDYLMIPDVFTQAVQVRLGWFTPFALSIQFALRYRSAWVLKHFSVGVIEGVILLRSVLTAVCLAYLLSISHNPLSQYYHVGLVVIVVYVNTIQRLRFWYAVAFSLIVLGISIAQALMLPAFEPRLTWPITLLLAVTVAFTLMPVYALERDERRRYLLTRRRAHLLDDLAEVQQRLQALSSTDALTGLSNRRHLRERLEQVWRRAQHERSEMSILMLDVDHFKAYNDRYGHPAGDRCLASVAGAVADCVRGPADIAARFGGEEFIVVLPGTGGAGAQRVAERILQAVQSLAIPHEATTAAGVVSVSIGVAACRAGPDRNEAFLIASADSALYLAKQAGRNRVQRAMS